MLVPILLQTPPHRAVGLMPSECTATHLGTFPAFRQAYKSDAADATQDRQPREFQTEAPLQPAGLAHRPESARWMLSAAGLPSCTAATVRSSPAATQSPPAQTPRIEMRRSPSTAMRPPSS